MYFQVAPANLANRDFYIKDIKVTEYKPPPRCEVINGTVVFNFFNGEVIDNRHYLPDRMCEFNEGLVFFDHEINVFSRYMGIFCGLPVTTPIDDVVAVSLPHPGVSC